MATYWAYPPGRACVWWICYSFSGIYNLLSSSSSTKILKATRWQYVVIQIQVLMACMPMFLVDSKHQVLGFFKGQYVN